MPSVKQPHLGVALAAGLAVMLCGCTTTQTTAARLQLNDSRLRAEAQSVRVGAQETSSTVTVAAKTFLNRGTTVDVAVTLENHGDAAVSDLPISVGYQRGSRTVYLNGAQGLAYFEDHIPSIPAHGSLTWVYTGAGKLARRARTFVRVGATPSVAVGRVTPPVITVTAADSAAGGAATPKLAVRLTNRSSITQYQVPVYAVVTRRGRIVAASAGSIADLSAGGRAVIHIALGAAGATGTTGVRVEAPATIFK